MDINPYPHGYMHGKACTPRVSFYVDCSSTRFEIMVGWKCSHVGKLLANRPHFGCLLECGGQWTRAT